MSVCGSQIRKYVPSDRGTFYVAGGRCETTTETDQLSGSNFLNPVALVLDMDGGGAEALAVLMLIFTCAGLPCIHGMDLIP